MKDEIDSETRERERERERGGGEDEVPKDAHSIQIRSGQIDRETRLVEPSIASSTSLAPPPAPSHPFSRYRDCIMSDVLIARCIIARD